MAALRANDAVVRGLARLQDQIKGEAGGASWCAGAAPTTPAAGETILGVTT